MTEDIAKCLSADSFYAEWALVQFQCNQINFPGHESDLKQALRDLDVPELAGCLVWVPWEQFRDVKVLGHGKTATVYRTTVGNADGRGVAVVEHDVKDVNVEQWKQLMVKGEDTWLNYRLGWEEGSESTVMLREAENTLIKEMILTAHIFFHSYFTRMATTIGLSRNPSTSRYVVVMHDYDSEWFEELCARCWSVDPERRPTAQEVFEELVEHTSNPVDDEWVLGQETLRWLEERRRRWAMEKDEQAAEADLNELGIVEEEDRRVNGGLGMRSLFHPFTELEKYALEGEIDIYFEMPNGSEGSSSAGSNKSPTTPLSSKRSKLKPLLPNRSSKSSPASAKQSTPTTPTTSPRKPEMLPQIMVTSPTMEPGSRPTVVIHPAMPHKPRKFGRAKRLFRKLSCISRISDSEFEGA
ncbi:hypothetical protein BC938DRAFT_473952 [Jimgerdemannia flammicorona]|uniref:Protein kinase domain-containing protein n=1 Tax=Jimgerdemannia flammicorona TaxID=994334 RepID=A0A433Q3F9_9FUNG|nr:hypothetical protein BC938DRAFT_473952 [Jimgerdemannia flammicorona]